MKSFVHAGQRCTVTESGLVFDSEVRTPLDSDWGCDIANYADSATYAEYLHANFPPAIVREVEAWLRDHGAFDPGRARVRTSTSVAPPPIARGPLPKGSPPRDRMEFMALARSIAGAFGCFLDIGPWTNVELEDWGTRRAMCTGMAGDVAFTMTWSESSCDSSAGPRLIGERAEMVVDFGARGTLVLSSPPLVAVGPRSLTEALVAAGVLAA